MSWFSKKKKEEIQYLQPLQWIAVDNKKVLVATANIFEELRKEPIFDETSHRVYEKNGGTWSELIGSYGVSVDPYVSPNEKGLVPAVVKEGSQNIKRNK